ncbi:MAG: hypothetical protein K0S11_552 [Gammaproteobacteria bacterium]|jgi:hypothetical protein|nr:hypothetical protein [Gammaproteobacteria bacterium]
MRLLIIVSLASLFTTSIYANSYYVNEIKVAQTSPGTGYVSADYRGGSIENLPPNSQIQYGPTSYFQLFQGYIINANGARIPLPETCRVLVHNNETLHFIGTIKPDASYTISCKLTS